VRQKKEGGATKKEDKMTKKKTEEQENRVTKICNLAQNLVVIFCQ
jgi:hypothetical protein